MPSLMGHAMRLFLAGVAALKGIVVLSTNGDIPIRNLKKRL